MYSTSFSRVSQIMPQRQHSRVNLGSIIMAINTRTGFLLVVCWVVVLCYTWNGSYHLRISVSKINQGEKEGSSNLLKRLKSKSLEDDTLDDGGLRRKVILFTTKSDSVSTTFVGTDRAEKKCPQCIFTHEQSRWNESDAILFNGRYLEPQAPYKPPGQVWVYYFFEAPNRHDIPVSKHLPNYKNLFNWTLTYRRDSEIFKPYAQLLQKDPQFDRDAAMKRFRNKTNMAAWIVSHCKTESQREDLVQELSKHVQVDIYGKCGQLQCLTPREKSMGNDCRKRLSDKYKFYLAFENALCQDYVTEKYYDVLWTDMVPIVYSGANYTALGVPKGSYVNVADFGSVEKLANHLHWLDQHPEEYMKLLESRAGLVTAYGHTETNWCKICEKLWAENLHSHTYPDLRDWWKGTADRKPMCVSPPRFVTES